MLVWASTENGKKYNFPKGYYAWVSEQQDWEADQEIDDKMRWERMEEAPENSKESSHSAHANGMNEQMYSSSDSKQQSYISKFSGISKTGIYTVAT